MQPNKVLKSLFIAIPVMTMMACSSSPSDADIAAQNKAAQEAAAAEAAKNQSGVQTGAVEPVLSPAEQQKKDIAALSAEQTVYFDFDRSSISSEFYSVLDKHAAFLVKNPGVTVVIEGHCDSRGTPEYNIALGERRAKSIETYLQNAGVSLSQISVVSYGEEKPAVLGNTEAAFVKNRRGVLVYR